MEGRKKLPAQLSAGKLPPASTELECVVLGAVLQEKPACVKAMQLISTEDIFYLERHKMIMKAVMQLFAEGEPVDLITVTHELRKMGKLQDVGGVTYLTQLTTTVSSGENMESHIRKMQELWMKRELIRIGHQLVQEGFTDTEDVFEMLDKVQHEVIRIVEGIDNGRTHTVQQALKDSLASIRTNTDDEHSLTGVPTPYTYLNSLTGGWQKTDLVIIAARPAMGKSALMLALARAAVKAEVGTAIFSLEMSVLQLTYRLISQETHVCSASDLSRGRVSHEKLSDLTRKLHSAWKYNMHLDDTPALSLVEFRSKAWTLKTQHNIGLIIIDYLQLMQGEGAANGSSKAGNREREISSISRFLKKTAKELDIPIIALAQLSRATETRGGDKRPQLSDLRESGAIEQDADQVFFLYRPEYYGIKETDGGIPTDGLGELICAKHRNGNLGTTFMKFHPEYTDFTEMNEKPEPVAKQAYRTSEPVADKWDSDYEPSPEEYNTDDFPF